MEPWMTASVAALLVGGGHYVSHRFVGDEVYNSKRAVSKAGVLLTGLTWFAVYLYLSGMLEGLT